MNFREALRLAGAAAWANLRPGAVLWVVLVGFVALYVWSAGFRAALAQVAEVKLRGGYWFAFGAYVLCAGALPEALRVVFFRGGFELRKFLFAALVWGTHGVISDGFYRCQTWLFGAGTEPLTLVAKVVADQFVFSFFENGWILVAFAWRDGASWREIFAAKFLRERYFPLIVAVWCVWIPGTCVIYFMPPPLQLPVASLIVCFWVLIFSFVQRGKV